VKVPELDLLGGVLIQSTWAMMPILLAALGEILTERSGVVNIGLEGIMLISALFSVFVADKTLNPWLGVLTAIGIGAFIGLIHGFISVYLKGNQIISGLGINTFAAGFVAYSIEVFWGVRGYYTPKPEAKVPRLPVIGVSPLFLATIAITIVLFIILYKFDIGLKIRACGENPEAADVVGVKVELMQLTSTIIGGALTGLAGAVLSIDWLASITKQLPAGRGFIALALVNFANWNPLYGLLGSFIFGFLWTASEYMKNLEYFTRAIPMPLINTIPYIATLIVVAGVIGRSRPPQSVGVPYRRELD
jgi:simple sugar transport system permease protein